MSSKSLGRSQIVAHYSQVWTEEWVARLEAYRKAGDQRGVDRIKFCRYLKMMRLLRNLTQAEAGRELRRSRKLEAPERASRDGKSKPNRERELWNSWEQAHHLPTDENIRRIAAILDGDPAGFLRRAGRPIPKELLVYDEAWAANIFRRKLRDARSFVQLADAVQAIWQKYILEQTGAGPHFKIDTRYSEVLEMVYLYLGEKQQIELARQIVRRRNDEELERHVKDAFRLREEVERRFRSMETTQLPALNETLTMALDELGIIPGRFDGVKNEMRTLLEKLAMRDQQPITDSGLFIDGLMEQFELVRGFENELTNINEVVTETTAKVNSRLSTILEKRVEALELMFQLCEMIAKLHRRVATIIDQPQRTLDELESGLENSRQRSKRKSSLSSASHRSSSQRGPR